MYIYICRYTQSVLRINCLSAEMAEYGAGVHFVSKNGKLAIQ